MKIITEEQIDEAALCLRNGGLVAFPTETVYGLGANALDPVAVAGIFEAKKRPSFDPLIVHISDISQLSQLFSNPVDPLVYTLASEFMPGPLTIVHRKSALVPELVTSGMENVAVRMPAHAIAHKLIKLSGVPVAAPSANLFGQLSPTSYKHVAKQQMDIDYLIAGDDAEHLVGIESTVVLVENGTCTILRPGVITAEDISQKLNINVTIASHNHKVGSPGLLNSHYSPRKPLYFYDDNQFELPEGSGLILHTTALHEIKAAKIIYTSHTANLLEVAAHLFTCLHEMEDDTTVTQIYIAPVEEKGVGISVMDRLKKATYQYR
ncbi:MAG: threonylcarbamoyl-AMP synthase [Bacteroidetes bacterium]|jgi:L-threonylcarbamoyladenylate synthase|nr:threonylcarbamoyl-AMP synthase [Bacteroidota bacterium]